ncbi:MAG: caspase family protein [Saprospiraceae bacterium]|nr:caspase family protein [Saprospiraceae bacterium]
MKTTCILLLSLCIFSISLSGQQCLSGNCLNGSGVYLFPSGAKYVGQFKNGVPSGTGSCAYSDGRKYQGEWLNGLQNGKGIQIFPDGSRIRGVWSMGRIVSEEQAAGPQSEFRPRNIVVGCISGDCDNGEGIYIFPSGAVYIGHFRNGEVHGIGVCDYSDGSRYSGEWKNRFPDGTGTKTYADGSRRTGRWERGQPIDDTGNLLDGLIRMQESRIDIADIQSGCIAGDCYSGTGTMAYPDGSRYDGAFQGGKPQGQGNFQYANHSRYSGSFSVGLPHGDGTLFRPDGTQLTGRWENGEFAGAALSPGQVRCTEGDCFNGTGTYVFKNGAKYTGTFLNNLPHGSGTVTYPNGEKYIGEMAEATFNGRGTLYLSDGTPVSGYWKNGAWLGENPLQPTPTPVPPPPVKPFEPPRPQAKVWAVVIGVASYNHMPTLRYTDDDAYRLYAFLKSPGGGAVPDDQIRILIDEDATRERILTTINETFFRAGPNDMVVLYFSGHGLKGSFLPFDFDGFDNKLFHEDITAALRNSRARYKLCIVDACHSGSLLAMRGSSSQQLIATYYDQLAKAEGGTALFLSSKSEETSLESSGLRQGVFSHFLIRGLKGEADADGDKLVTIQELYEYVHSNVRTYTGYQQSPVITGDYDRKMVIAVKP